MIGCLKVPLASRLSWLNRQQCLGFELKLVPDPPEPDASDAEVRKRRSLDALGVWETFRQFVRARGDARMVLYTVEEARMKICLRGG